VLPQYQVLEALDLAWKARCQSGLEMVIPVRNSEPLRLLTRCKEATEHGCSCLKPGCKKNLAIAATLFGFPSDSGHERAGAMLALTGVRERRLPQCFTDPESMWDAYEAADNRVDIERYVDALPRERRVVAALIRSLAPRFGVERRLALAIAAVESNFDTRARSSKNAMGVMQLIPETAKRFKVRNAFDTQQNVRGGLACLGCCSFGGTPPWLRPPTTRAKARSARWCAPYAETRSYVRRGRQYLHLPKARDVLETLRAPE
jgi:transglycosylase-like protein with SLT domain